MDILYGALQSPYKWYTGRPLKRFLNTKVFGLSKDFSNRSIDAGRWKAYCHYSRAKSLLNLLHKANVGQDSKVLIQPPITRITS
jgi:hypothetical protein